MSIMRTRWAAIGAAVAVSLGAGGLTMVDAAKSSGDLPVTVLLDEPCRLRDTRPNKGVGGRTTPIAEGEAYTVQGTGPSGECDVPVDAVGLVTNVTAVLPSAPTDLRLFPTGSAVPKTSNLNPAPGQPPTPNSVTVGLSGAGEFDVLNKFGSVHVIVDVAAYLVDHAHTGDDIVDESITGNDIKNDTVSNIDTSNEPGVASSFSNTGINATNSPSSMISTSIRVPSDGHVMIQVTGNWFGGTNDFDDADCQLQKGAVAAIDKNQPWFRLGDRDVSGLTSFSAHRVLPIAAADNPFLFNSGQSIRLVCDEFGAADDIRLDDLHISAAFFATSYEPDVIVIGP